MDNRPEWGKKLGRGCLMPQRGVIALMGFFCLICAYTNRVSISHAITELVVPINRTDTSTEDVCPAEDVKDEINLDKGEYHWSEQLQGYILGSFYIGYLITHLPGGILSDKYGAKWVLTICMLVSGIVTCLTPVSIDLGEEWGLMFIRVVMGAAQGPLFPALTTLLSAWVPAKERGTLGSFCYSGVTAGTVCSNVGAGMMLYYYHWSVTFYVLGASTVIWVILFAVLCSSRPGNHPCIKPKEVEYLSEQIPQKNVAKMPIPWKGIFANKVTWAVIVSQVGHDWGYFVMITCLPKYIANVLRFNIRSNGIVSALPFVAMWVCTIFSGWLADYLIQNGKLSIDVERKLWTFLGAFGPGAFTVIASYAGCNKTWVIVLFTLAMFTMGFYYAGQKLSPLDLSPAYAGTLMAITNGLGSIAGFASPSIVGFLTPNATLREWRGVFWLGFIILVFSSVVFAIWGSAEVQPYDPSYAGEKKEG